MNVDTWHLKWKRVHREYLLRAHGTSTTQTEIWNTKKKHVQTHTNGMWKKAKDTLYARANNDRNGNRGQEFFHVLLRSEFVLEEAWSTPRSGTSLLYMLVVLVV